MKDITTKVIMITMDIKMKGTGASLSLREALQLEEHKIEVKIEKD